MYPMVLFLHGSGERGSDNEAQLIHGGDLFLRDSIRDKYPAIIVFPPMLSRTIPGLKCRIVLILPVKESLFWKPIGKPTKNMKLVKKLVKYLIAQYPITKHQLYVGGLSLGGMGTFEIVRREPKLFAAAFPICGGADTAIAPRLKNVNWWIFHGAKDQTVDPQYSKVMVHALQEINVPVKFTLYPDANHNSWDSAFAEPGLMAWLFSNKK